jgi:hypothetical protein
MMVEDTLEDDAVAVTGVVTGKEAEGQLARFSSVWD